MLFDEDLEQERSEKKKILQEQFMKKMKSNKQSNSSSQKAPSTVSAEEYEKLKLKYESEKKKRKTLEKSLKKAESKIKSIQKDNNEIKVHERKTMSLFSNLRSEKAEANIKANQLEKDLHKADETINNLTNRIHKFEEASKKARLPKLEKWNRDLLQKLLLQKKQNQSLKHQLKSLENKAKIGKTMIQVEKNKKQDEDILRMQEKIRKLKEKVKSYQSELQADNLILILEDFISEENLSMFFDKKQNKLGKLAEKVGSLQKEIKNREKLKQKLLMLQNMKEKDIVTFDERLGYITKKNSTWYFIDISNNNDNALYGNFVIDKNYTSQKFKMDQPVKVIIQENKANVIQMYKEVPKIAEINIPEVNNHGTEQFEGISVEAKPVITYPYFGNFKVLIIGARNLTEYKNRLMKHGLEVIVHNPFEESYTRLHNKYAQSDVVLVCTSHISHSALDHINKENPKVELIERDNEDVIAARTRFASLQLGLIKIDTTAS